MFVNKAFIIGNLTRDPEKKALPSGQTVTTFSVATNRVWKDKNGAKQESADYHNIVVFGRVADNCAAYLKRGQTVFVEGRMQTRSWDAPDGSKRYRTEVVADTVQFGPKAGMPGSAPSSANSSKQESTSQLPDSGEQIEYPEEEINPEDIPF